MLIFILAISILINQISASPESIYKPEQIHLSLGDPITTYVITWLTFHNSPNKSFVDWKTDNGVSGRSFAETTSFVLNGFARFTHRANITNVEPGRKYIYKPAKDFIKHISNFRYAIYGDLGVLFSGENILPLLTQETARNSYDIVIHNGDFAYDMHTDNGTRGDKFMRMIEPVAAIVPYLTTPGNHEAPLNFTHYKNRFSMMGNTDNQWFSFDLGETHLIMLSTEVYFSYSVMSPQMMIDQYEWLEEDLKKANENRKKVPWIVTFGHRPMYCSTKVHIYGPDDCHTSDSILRVGLKGIRNLGLEDLFYHQGVDLAVWSHEHSYIRMFPLYNEKIYNGSREAPYTNPKAPVHIITGAAGCWEKPHGFQTAKPWDAYRSKNWSYSIMQVHNATHMHWQQIRANDSAIEDEIWLIKDSHGPYTTQ